MRQVLDDRPRISLCMIVRNEERFIRQCLTSVRQYVDQIVVVDTGSTDSTIPIARELGAEIFEHPWANDFSEARNYSISQATGEWILILDADEMLAERDALQLRRFVSDSCVEGLKLIQRTYLQSANFVCATPNPKDYEEGHQYSDCVNVSVIRLFRNDPRIRYAGKVHELVEPSFVAQRLSHNESNLVIHHFGKVGDSAHLERKKHLYLELGRKKVLEQPQNALAHFELGVQLYELERYAECVSCFETSFKLNPRFDLALLYLAKAFHLTQQMDEAARYFQACLKRFPKSDKVLFDYGNFVRDRGNAKGALKLYQKAVAVNPGHALALFNMGVLCVQMGEPDRGMAFIERAIQLNLENSTFHENLARLPLPKSAMLSSVRLLERYVGKFPRSVDCIAAIADMQFKLGKFRESIQSAERALALDSERLPVLLVKAHASLSLGELDKADDAYHAALEVQPGNLDSMMNLAAIAETRGNTTEAREWYLRVLNLHPGHTGALKRFAAAQTTAGVDPEAASALERACPSDLADPQCLLLVGSLLERAGKIQRATQLYQSAALQKPEWSGMIDRKIQQLAINTNRGGTANVPFNS
jgi:tetratricopeptide (TPR) repeat protein